MRPFTPRFTTWTLPNGEEHIANIRDPQIPAALAPAIQGVASLHDFFLRSHSVSLGPVSFDRASKTWKPRTNINIGGSVYHTLAPYDLATIYDLLPLWKQGFTGRGVTIAAVEDSNLLHTSDWQEFRKTFGLDKFTHGTFRQIYPGCRSPGQNGDETEAALDVEWSSAAAPDANIELSACANTATTSGLDLAILGLIDFARPISSRTATAFVKPSRVPRRLLSRIVKPNWPRRRARHFSSPKGTTARISVHRWNRRTTRSLASTAEITPPPLTPSTSGEPTSWRSTTPTSAASP